MQDQFKQGTILNTHYRVVKSLGEGGFGQVLLADDAVVAGRRVAIKVLHDHNDLVQDDLIREMEMLSKLDHPHVVSLYHHFRLGERYCLVMEFCEGGSLRGGLDTGNPKTDEAVDWTRTLCELLEFVHSHGIVHHDIKPENILFSRDGQIKLGDFGVANRNAGTRIYMPPEWLRGEAVSARDPRIDTYALGVTLLEMLSGDNPFLMLAPADALNSKSRHDFVPTNLPRWLQEVLLKATHPTPELRFQTMSEFGEAIETRHVPIVFSRSRITAHAMAEKAEKLIAKRRWRKASQNIDLALRTDPECVSAVVAAGRLELILRRIAKARMQFARALTINPRIHVQRELGWLALEEGNFPQGISLLNDHLHRSPSDFEACNLLLECFYLTDRYDQGEELAALMMKQPGFNDCFRNNRFLCRLLNGGYSASDLEKQNFEDISNPFIRYNLTVVTEEPKAWAPTDGPTLKSKLVFQDYRFGQHSGRRTNTMVFRLQDGAAKQMQRPTISLGRSASCDIVLDDRNCSRRHALFLNFPDDCWVINLSGRNAVTVDGQPVFRKAFVDGVRDVTLAGTKLRLATKEDLLI
jgi:serine/threonine protein kinase